MPIESTDDLTRANIEADAKFGTFEPDPSDPLVMLYVPSDKELKRIETYLKEEIDQAVEDDKPRRQMKLALLEMFKAKGNSEKKIIELPLVKRAVKQKVAWVTNTIMGHKPIATITPDSNDVTEVLVDDPRHGPMPIEKTSEETAQALELWLEYKLRKCLGFRRIVRDACLEAKRGQTPTYLKVCHYPQKRVMRAPRFEKKGPIAVTFTTKEDRKVEHGEATTIENLSTYMALMPADEQDLQTSRWFSEFDPCSNERFRARLNNGEFHLIDKAEYEKLIEEGPESEQRDSDQRKAAQEKKIPGKVRPWHDIQRVWFFWTIPVKDEVMSADAERPKKATSNEEYSMVGCFHRRLGRLLSMQRNPLDGGFRPYRAIYDWKEPFRNDDESTAEYNAPYQRVFSDLISLEIQGGVIATTPVFYTEPGSMAGEWMAEHVVQPGDVIPRMRKEEIEKDTLGERPQSLIGLAQFIHSQFERDNSLGDLQLGLNIPSRTPSSSIAQVLNQGETVEDEFLEDFRLDLGEVLKMYVQTVQQYMRFGEVIPFDPETRATIMAALQGENPEQVPSQIPVRFPQEPINRQFAFDIAASSDDRSKQGDFDRLIALKGQVDADGAKFAQMVAVIPQLITATASGQVGPEVLQMLAQDFDRSEFIMEQLGKAMRRDGAKFAIDRRLMRTLVANTLEKEKQAVEQAAQQAAMQGAQSGGQPTAVPNAPGVGVQLGGPGAPPQSEGNPAAPGQPGGLGAPVPESGVPQQPVGNQGGAAQAPVGQPVG